MGGILAAAEPIISKLLAFIPDPQQKAAAQLALFQAQQAGEFKELDAQVALAGQQADIDKAEAQSSDRLQHWRGAAGWVCVAGLAWTFVGFPVLSCLLAATGHMPKGGLPVLDNAQLWQLTAGMLGLGGWHVYGQVRGVK